MKRLFFIFIPTLFFSMSAACPVFCQQTAPKKGAPEERAGLERELKELRGEKAGLSREIRQFQRKAEADNTELAGINRGSASQLLRDKALLIKTRNNLGLIRSALTLYYGDTEGSFPEDLTALTPKYIKTVPETGIPGCEKTSKARVLTRFPFADPKPAIKGTCGWLYITDKNSKLYGRVFIDSAFKENGKPLYQY